MIAKKITACLLILFIITSIPAHAQQDGRKNLEETLKEREEIKKQKREEFERLRSRVQPLMHYDLELLQAAIRVKVFEIYDGAKVVSLDPITEEVIFLGSIEDEFSTNSIFNEYGPYGSQYSSNSIWNEYGQYGGKYSSRSPFNPYCTAPPTIIKDNQVIGFLTINKRIEKSIDPNWLKTYFKY